MNRTGQTWLTVTALVSVAIAAGLGWYSYKTRTDPRWMPFDLLAEQLTDPANQPVTTALPGGGTHTSYPPVWSVFRERLAKDMNQLEPLLTHEDPTVTLAVLSSLGYAYHSSTWPTMLTQVHRHGARHSDTRIRNRSWELILEMADSTKWELSIDDLIAILDDPDPQTCHMGMRIIFGHGIHYRSDAETRRIVTSVLKRLNDPDEKVHSSANGMIRSLIFHGNTQENRELLFAAHGAPTDESRKDAQQKLMDWWEENGATYDFSKDRKALRGG